jgi:nitroreductase
MDARDALRSTSAVRRFTDEPVDDALLHDILDDARFAPSGGNRQPWRVVVVKDVPLRRRLGDLMRPVWAEYIAVAATGVTPFAAVAASPYIVPEAMASAPPNNLIESIVAAPVVLVIGVDLGGVAMLDKDLERPALVGGASIYPFCWNLLLSARTHGLGGVLTTFLSRAEPLAAPELGLPDTYALAATLFLGHPVRQRTKLKRKPVEEFTTVDRFDGPAFGPFA